MVTPKLRFKGFDESWKISDFEKADIKIIDGDRGNNYPKSNDFYNQEFCLFLNAGNVTKSGFRFENTQFIDEKKDSLLRKGKLKREDIIITTRGTVGNIAYFDDSVTYENMRINSGMVIVRSNKNVIPAYLNQFLTSNIFEKWTEKNVFGSAQPQLTVKLLKSIPISLPSTEEQTKIASFLSAVDNKIVQLTQEHELLSEYKKGMMQQLFSQKLRFKADDGSDFINWDYMSLDEVLDYEQPTKYIVESTDYDDSFKIPVLTAGKSFILGFTDEDNGIFEAQKQNVIIFDDFTTAYKFVDFPFKVKSSAMKILKTKSENYDIFYIYLVFSIINLPKGAEHKRRWISEYSQIEIPMPSLPEQTKIANFLSAIDQKTDNVAAQIDQAKDWKKGLLQQMFV